MKNKGTMKTKHGVTNVQKIGFKKQVIGLAGSSDMEDMAESQGGKRPSVKEEAREGEAY